MIVFTGRLFTIVSIDKEQVPSIYTVKQLPELALEFYKACIQMLARKPRPQYCKFTRSHLKIVHGKIQVLFLDT